MHDDDVKSTVLTADRMRVANPKIDSARGTFLGRQVPSSIHEIRADINGCDMPFDVFAPRDISRNDAGTATDVENRLLSA
jgi:hypothetical protein